MYTKFWSKNLEGRLDVDGRILKIFYGIEGKGVDWIKLGLCSMELLEKCHLRLPSATTSPTQVLSG
jgi:hypothetical protein